MYVVCCEETFSLRISISGNSELDGPNDPGVSLRARVTALRLQVCDKVSR